MSNIVKDKNLLAKLLPNYPIGCRRITPSPNFLQLIQEPHVDFCTDSIEKISKMGVVTLSGFKECEVLILATGFAANFIPAFQVTGKNGVKLDEKWKHHAIAYLSISVPECPNLFLCLGPNAPLGSNSTLPVLERVSKYIWSVILASKTAGIQSVEVDEQITNQQWNDGQEWLKSTVWASRGCGSWYKRGGEVGSGGVIQGIWPGTTNSYLKIVRSVNWNHYHVYPDVDKSKLAFSGSELWPTDGGLSDVKTSFDWTDWDYQLSL
jgi:hypothetical protein